MKYDAFILVLTLGKNNLEVIGRAFMENVEVGREIITKIYT